MNLHVRERVTPALVHGFVGRGRALGGQVLVASLVAAEGKLVSVDPVVLAVPVVLVAHPRRGALRTLLVVFVIYM